MEKKPFFDILRNGTANAAHSRLKKGVRFHEKDATGKTTLHLAVTRSGFETIVIDIISKGVKIEAVDRHGRMPLHDAALAGASTSILDLIVNAATINAKDKQGRTALHDAVLSGIENNVRLLLQRGADIKAEDNNGCTALQQEFAPGCDRMLCLLISQNANESRLERAKTGTIRFRNNTGTGAQEGLESPIRGACRLEHWSFEWAGLEVYKTEQADFENVLTISTRDPGTHAYTAMTVDEYLQEFFPCFGSMLLMWIKNVCCYAVQPPEDLDTAKSLQEIRIGGPANEDISCPSVPTVQGDCSGDNGYLTLTGMLRSGILTITLSAPEDMPTSDVKAALAWTLTALEPQEPGVTGLFSVPADAQALDDGLPRALEPISCNAESYCWKEMFSSAVVMNLRQETTKDTEQTQGLEIDLDLLVEVAAVDQEAQFTNGSPISFGFDTAIVPLEPVESRKWHFFRTPGRQITAMRALRELRKHFGEEVELARQPLLGKVYVGWCNNPIVDSLPSIEVSRGSGVSDVEEYEEQPEGSSTKDQTLFARANIAWTLTFGASASFKRERNTERPAS